MAEPVALYRMYDAQRRLLYVGISKWPEYRFTQHAHDKGWWLEVTDISIEWFDERAYALCAEADAIWYEDPFYNRSRPPTRAERSWGFLATGCPALLRLEHQCLVAADEGVRCIWPDVLSELKIVLDETRRDGETSLTESALALTGAIASGRAPYRWHSDADFDIARNHLLSLLPESCSCPSCLEAY